MSSNSRSLAQISTYAFDGWDEDLLRRCRPQVTSDNPLRVHRHAEGYIVSLGMFHGEAGDAKERLKKLRMSDRAIETMAAAAATGASYLDIYSPASAILKTVSYMDVSTAHLRVRDAELLEGIVTGEIVCNVPVVTFSTRNGYIVDLRAERTTPERLAEFGFSDEFIALIDHARRNDAVFVDFDNDADYEPGFSIFDQETDEDITVAMAEDGFRHR